MAQASCRCGQPLDLPPEGVEHIVCPKCGARVRIIRRARVGGDPGASAGPTGDGAIRFACPCGRRLKVSAANPPTHGKCPDCGRIVPVPAVGIGPSPALDVESPTEELSAADLAAIEAWSARQAARVAQGASAIEPAAVPSGRAEAGIRICPRCGKPVHMSATTCRNCGATVPKR